MLYSNIAIAGLLCFSSPLDNLGFFLEILTVFLRGFSKSVFWTIFCYWEILFCAQSSWDYDKFNTEIKDQILLPFELSPMIYILIAVM